MVSHFLSVLHVLFPLFHADIPTSSFFLVLLLPFIFLPLLLYLSLAHIPFTSLCLIDGSLLSHVTCLSECYVIMVCMCVYPYALSLSQLPSLRLSSLLDTLFPPPHLSWFLHFSFLFCFTFLLPLLLCCSVLCFFPRPLHTFPFLKHVLYCHHLYS